MTIIRCSLALIQSRGSRVTPPTQIAVLDFEEQNFLERHVADLRGSAKKDTAVRARFCPDSYLEGQFQILRAPQTNQSKFLGSCSMLVESLAQEMGKASRAEDCVVAIMASDEPNSEYQTTATLLKLDAEVEGANLEPHEDGSIRLKIFQHLLPAPGKLQKGLSWPDDRPDSELILLDTNSGAAAQYFQKAFLVEASPRPLACEKALSQSIQKLRPMQAKAAIERVKNKSGPADQIVAELKSEFPELDITPVEFGGSGGYAGTIRQDKIEHSKTTYISDGIELSVPLVEMDRVTVNADGAGFVTTIRTSHPLGPFNGGAEDL